MDRLERFYRIDQLLNERRTVPLPVFLDELQVSLATFKRDLEYMRSRFNAPIEWDRELRGYRWGKAAAQAPKYELPGLWFNPSEIHALLTMQQLLHELEPGLLTPHVAPLLARLEALLEAGEGPARQVRSRVRVLHMARRAGKLPNFGVVARALLDRRRLQIAYYNRERDELSARTVSPQRLVHYRDNWYLDAWCHLRDDLRSFALDAVREAAVLDQKAKDVPEKELSEVLGSAYGIFSGRPKARAKLRFSPLRARWVSQEAWHPDQKGTFDDQGRYVLEVPYADDRELIMDILKYGPDVEVLGPAELRRKVAERLAEAAQRYR
ncbi:MAG TPA: WYL domain-containing protein [Nevskiales bacterium]|nr:WYL domain-containing protein [Nevskiales bacterium]